MLEELVKRIELLENKDEIVKRIIIININGI